MVGGNVDVLIHVERLHVFEGDQALPVELNQLFVHLEWRSTYYLK